MFLCFCADWIAILVQSLLEEVVLHIQLLLSCYIHGVNAQIWDTRMTEVRGTWSSSGCIIHNYISQNWYTPKYTEPWHGFIVHFKKKKTTTINKNKQSHIKDGVVILDISGYQWKHVKKKIPVTHKHMAYEEIRHQCWSLTCLLLKCPQRVQGGPVMKGFA